jgi:hypothetical protein
MAAMKTGWAALGLWMLAAAASGQQVEVPEGSAALVAITPAVSAAGRVELTLTWRHSWRDAEGSARGNHDGVWVFAKTLHADGRWRHARVAQASAAAGFDVERAADGAGVFVFRSQPGQGDARATLSLRWEGIAGAGSASEGSQRVRVFAWPMVKVPGGGFELGDGSATTPGRFHAGDDSFKPFSVTAAVIELAPRAGALWADATRTPLPAGAPGPAPPGTASAAPLRPFIRPATRPSGSSASRSRKVSTPTSSTPSRPRRRQRVRRRRATSPRRGGRDPTTTGTRWNRATGPGVPASRAGA